MEQPPQERQWTEHEKVRIAVWCSKPAHLGSNRADLHYQIYLLAEILKAAPVPSHVLFGFIRDNGVQARWNDMALPPGTCMWCSCHLWSYLSDKDHVSQPHLNANSPLRTLGQFMPKSIC